MIRIVLQNLLLFLLPTLIYLGYRALVARSPGAIRRAIDEAPYGWLTLTGLAVVGVFVALFATTDGGRPGQVYIPPAMKDGKLVPGHYLPDQPPAAATPGAGEGGAARGTAADRGGRVQ